MSFISGRIGQFTYFDVQLDHPTWRGKRVLDFGGNVGNILKDPHSTIDPDKYWCIDVSKDAIERGHVLYPEAHWIHYNRYNFAFNPGGVVGLEVPDTGQGFDYILAFSVFNHTSKAEMIELVNHLEAQLAAGGTLVFTFIDPHFNPWPGYYHGTNLKWRLEMKKQRNPAVDVDSLLERASQARWCALVNDDDLYIENDNVKPYEAHEKKNYHQYYTAQYMRTLFPEAEIFPPHTTELMKTISLPADGLPPVYVGVHHCCVIRKNG